MATAAAAGPRMAGLRLTEGVGVRQAALARDRLGHRHRLVHGGWSARPGADGRPLPACCGRAAALAELSGDGVAELGGRLG